MQALHAFLLSSPHVMAAVVGGGGGGGRGGAPEGQGLTLVHFSAQPEPFPTQNTPYTPPKFPLTPPVHLLNNSPMQPPISQRALTLS